MTPRACVLATTTATVAFGGMAVAQHVGSVPMWRPPMEGAGTIAAFAADFPVVTGVPLEAQQLLLNLVANAEGAVASAAGRRAITIGGVIFPLSLPARPDSHGVTADRSLTS